MSSHHVATEVMLAKLREENEQLKAKLEKYEKEEQRKLNETRDRVTGQGGYPLYAYRDHNKARSGANPLALENLPSSTCSLLDLNHIEVHSAGNTGGHVYKTEDIVHVVSLPAGSDGIAGGKFKIEFQQLISPDNPGHFRTAYLSVKLEPAPTTMPTPTTDITIPFTPEKFGYEDDVNDIVVASFEWVMFGTATVIGNPFPNFGRNDAEEESS